MYTSALNISNVTSPAAVRCTRDTRVTHVLFPVLYTLLFLVGVTLNALSIWVFVRIPSTSTFIVYLKSTLVADFVMSLMLPFKIISDSGLGPWHLKAFVCRYSAVIFYTTMYISIALLGLIALDRFLKIVQPCGKICMENVSLAKMISGIVWLGMFALALPNIIFSNMEATPTTVKKCSSLKSQFGLQWHAAVNYICQIIFWAVFIQMILFYTVIAKKVYESYKSSRSKAADTPRRMKAKVFIVVAVFFVCFAPFHFVRVPYTHSQTGGVSNCSVQNRLFVAKESTLWLAATNICMDPLIYIFLCKPFREKLSCFVTRTKKTSSLDTAATQLNNGTTL